MSQDKTNEKLNKMTPEEQTLWTQRHSAEHVLMMAMRNLGYKFHMAMGPATSDGFYFDFELTDSSTVTEDDFPKLEKEMGKIIKQNLPFSKQELEPTEAQKLFKNNPYKQEWIKEAEDRGEIVSVYWTGDKNDSTTDSASFVDLCAGPHVETTGQIGKVKLVSIAGAYWRGNENNIMLTRIYGTAFPTQKELDDYVQQMEDAKLRDHKKLGKDLDLFFVDETVGQGLPLFTEKGATIKRELERWVVDEEIKRGYVHVETPDLARTKLYEISGHYPYYAGDMYPVMEVDETKLVLRPMTCPHHFINYKHHLRSYRDLPLRIAELAKLYRYEKSGELSGLQRVRGFCLADAHIFCTEDQAASEVENALQLIIDMSSTLGLKLGENYRFRLSLGDSKNNDKYYDDPAGWSRGEDTLRKVLNKMKAPYFEAVGEAAFYGPKIDVQMTNVYGKEDTAFTVQYDFCLPSRFKLKYIDQDNNEVQPIVVHRSSIGALERTIAFLIEFYAGAFPVWLHPTQVAILPISQNQEEYATSVKNKIIEALPTARVKVDDSNETLQKKIRNAQEMKIPYMLIIGKRETEANTVSLRLRNGEEPGTMPIVEFTDRLNQAASTRSLEL